jgi:hypothetical protein
MLLKKATAAPLQALANELATLRTAIGVIEQAAKTVGYANVPPRCKKTRTGITNHLQFLKKHYSLLPTVTPDAEAMRAAFGTVTGTQFTWRQHALAAIWMSTPIHSGTLTSCANSVRSTWRGRFDTIGATIRQRRFGWDVRCELDNHFCREDDTRKRPLVYYSAPDVAVHFLAGL